MRIIAADDERLSLELLTDTLAKALPDAEVAAFTKPSQVLAYAAETPCDVALLDIHMRTMTGLELAKKLKELQPEMNIIFVTGFSEYTGEAMQLHASGYIEKPVTADKLLRELEDLRYPVRTETSAEGAPLLTVRCFGSFAVFDRQGKPVHFGRVKAQECFAYLVSRCGASCSIREIAGVLFEDAPYDYKQANYMQKITASMMKSLREVGAETVVEKAYNAMSVHTERMDCDYYRFRGGDKQMAEQYAGEFMAQYPWGEYTAGYLDQRIYGEDR